MLVGLYLCYSLLHFFGLYSLEILFIGLIAGLNSATWGAYKDSIVEGFKFYTFLRSIIVWSIIAIILFLLFGVSDWILFLSVIWIERLFTELYKLWWRIEDQSKYKIPMYFSFYGKVIYNTFKRRLILFVVIVLFFIIAFYLSRFKMEVDFLKYIILSFLVGILVTIGWANKDAPFEGFDYLKVWRSTIVAIIWWFIIFLVVFLLKKKIPNILIYLFMIAGFERMVSEFYKSFIKKSIPGKFKEEKILYFNNYKCRSILFFWNISTFVFLIYLILNNV